MNSVVKSCIFDNCINTENIETSDSDWPSKITQGHWH